MIYEDNKVKDIQIAYVGGGSRSFAWILMRDLSRESRLSGTVKLYDIDMQAAKDNEIIGTKFNAHPDSVSDWKYQAVGSLQEAMTGADFVVISIMPGTLEEMDSDVHVPEKFGIYQAVGDTVGPGGMVRAMRTVPMYAEIGTAIKNFCPEAWVITYTNPMTICTRTLYAVHPRIRAFGCCHEVFGTQVVLKKCLKEMEGIEVPHRREININVLGINHFTWIDHATYKGIDIMPIFAKFVEKNYELGFRPDGDEDAWKKDHFTSALRVKYDLFRKYKLIPAAGDRHLAEFLPVSWYLQSPEMVTEWKFHLTKVETRKKGEQERIAKAQRLLSGEDEVEIKPTGEEGVQQMCALLGLEDMVTNVNMANIGQAGGIPLGAVVETNALFRKGAIKPVIAGTLPPAVNSLVLKHVYNQETIVEAGIKKDKALAFAAFVNDPLVSSLTTRDAEKLFNEMIQNTRKYLPGWKLD
ncbi:MAG: alpha-glucosidase/alpha-galactosidase [Planctomycetes bacterium]|nr:alpha-glucosidase/alpha-galactosidase [Planctomycetota bacterium]